MDQDFHNMFLDIYDISRISLYKKPGFLLVLLLMVLALVGIIWYGYRVYLQKKDAITPEEWLYRAFESFLFDNSLHDCKLFYEKITDSVKIYIEKKNGYSSKGFTHGEMLSTLNHTELAQTLAPILEVILNYSVNIRFGHMPYDKAMMAEHRKMLIDYITNRPILEKTHSNYEP